MANRTDTQSVINLVINGKQAMTSLRELTDTQRRLNTEMRNMRPSDPQYPARLRELQMINRALTEQRREIQGLNTESDKLKTNWKDIAGGIVGGFGISAGIDLIKEFGVQVFQTTAKFEKLEAVLTTTLGSRSGAQLAMKQIQKFASETPFAVDEITEAYVKLANRGFKPTMEQMTKMGDVAASTGKTFDQLVEAQLDAETGEFERLKEFGIRAEKEGDRVRFTFKGISQEVEFTSDAIRNYIVSLGDAEGISGSMASISETLSGKVSNLGDSWDSLLKTVGSETQGVFSSAISIMNNAIGAMDQYMSDLSLAQKYNAPGSSMWDRITGALGGSAAGGGGISSAQLKRREFAGMSEALDDQIGSTKYFKDLFAIQGDLLTRMKSLDRSTKEGAASYQLYADKLKMIKERSTEIATDREREKLIKQGDAAKKAAEEKEKADKKNKKLDDQEAKRILALYKKNEEDYKKLGIQRLDDQLSKNQKEIEQEERKYDDLIKREESFLRLKKISPTQKKNTEGRIDQLTSEKEAAINSLRLRQETETTEKILELRTRLTNAHESELQKETDLINKFYDRLEKENAGNQTVIDKLKLERVKELSNAELREKERLEEEKRKIESESSLLDGTAKDQKLAKINKQYDDEILALKRKYSKELQETQVFQDALAAIEQNRKNSISAINTGEEEDEKKDVALQSAQALSDAYFTISANNRRRESDMALAEINKQREQELSNKNLTESQKKAINDKFDAKVRAEKLKAWKADQRAALSQAVISGALSVIKALPNFILAGAAGIAAAAQIAVIATEKPPEFWTGVRNFEGGLAIVGDRGPEAVEENGKVWMANKPMLAKLEPGSNVFNANQTKSMQKTLGETLYPQAHYTLDSSGIRKAERNYRSVGQSPSFGPLDSSDNAGSNTANTNNTLSTIALEQKVDVLIDVLGKGLIFDYKAFEEFQTKIQYTRNSQSG